MMTWYFKRAKIGWIFIAVIVLFLGGCTTVWTKPDFSQSQFNRDNYECERDERQSNFGNDLYGSLAATEFRKECMRARGYTEVQ